MRSASFRIAVLSDLHAYGEGKQRPSFLDARANSLPINQHPISSLKKLICDSGNPLSADLLLCPGDLGHQSSVVGINYAWQQLQEIGTALGSKLIVGTAGNHDMDSRHIYTDFASDQTLKKLLPKFPLDGHLWDRYWARHYALVNDPNYRLLLLNSSAYHGNTPVEQNHGRIDTFTLEQIKDELSQSPSSELNVLLCHHHPQQHSEWNLGEEDVMKNGQLLLDLLGSGDFGEWLVVHGHKHHPKITYASGPSTSPVVFAAGSFSFRLHMEIESIARNQFYLLEFLATDLAQFGLVGTGSAWDWVSGTGWLPATPRSGLPASFGFGARDPRSLAVQIDQSLGTSTLAKWSDVCQDVKQVVYLLPSDVRLLETNLKARGIEILRDGTGTALEIGRL